MLYQLIEPGAKSDNNLIDENSSNKHPPEYGEQWEQVIQPKTLLSNVLDWMR